MTSYMVLTSSIGDILDIKSIGSNKITNGHYLIKIEEDYKLIIDSFLEKQQLEKVIRTYYSESSIEIFELKTSTPALINLISQSNSFLKTNEITPEELQTMLKQWDDVINYFNKYSNSKINDIFKQTINKINDENIKSDPFKIGYNNIFPDNIDANDDKIIKKPLLGQFNKDNSFEAYGHYITFNEIYQVIGYDKHSDNFMKIDNFDDNLLNTTNEIFNIYFNNQFNNIFIIGQSYDFIFHNKKINNLFPEISLITSVGLDNEKLEIIKKLNKDIFVNYEDAKSYLNRLLNVKIIDSKLSIDEIKDLIKKCFTINTNPSNCIKFTNIWNTISSEIKVSESYVNYIKRQLPTILTELGLQKKRLADGIYWYGLVVKNNNKQIIQENSFLNTKITEKIITNDDFNKYVQQRNVNFFDTDNFSTSLIKTNHTNLFKEPKNIILNPNIQPDTRTNEKIDTLNTTKVKTKSKQKPTKNKKITNKNITKNQPQSPEISKIIKKTKSDDNS